MDNLGMYDNNAMGVYTAQSQFDLDINKLKSLGFTSEEIDTLQYIMVNGGKLSTNALTQYGLSYEAAKKIRYMYDICVGKVIIESTDDLCKHLKKMFGGRRKIGISDLAVSKINTVPRKAIVAGITDSTFSIYNSIKDKSVKKIYDVIDVTGKRVTIETKVKPVLKYKQSKVVDGVIEIKELKANNNVIVSIDKKYIRLLNRFIIVASLRRPEFHNGMVELITIEGSKVYVYAQNMGTRDKVSYNMGTQRVYDYGYYPVEIQPKLVAVASGLYKHLCGVYATNIPSNQDFNILPIEDNTDDDDIDIED